MNRLPPEIFFLIIKRLSINKKFLLKAVCKKWNTFIISHVLPTQRKLSINTGYFSFRQCIDSDHQFQYRDNNSVPLLAVKANRKRRRFFENVTGVKVLEICEGIYTNRIMQYYMSEGPSSSLECLQVPCLEQPLVKVLPNLQHFSANSINLVSLISVLEYCPILTHLSIDTKAYDDNFVDTFINLPKGLQYLMLAGRSCAFLALLCSPAMQTLESVQLNEYWPPSVLFNKTGARVKPAPRLRKFSISCSMDREEHRRMIVDLLKECPALKKIDLYVEEFTLENYVKIFSRLSNLEMISLVPQFQFDDVIRVILRRNRKSLKYLRIDRSLLDLKSWKKLAKFKNLETLSFCSTVPSNEELLAFAQKRLDVSQSPLRLAFDYWDEIRILDPLVSALHDANIQLVSNEN